MKSHFYRYISIHCNKFEVEDHELLHSRPSWVRSGAAGLEPVLALPGFDSQDVTRKSFEPVFVGQGYQRSAENSIQ